VSGHRWLDFGHILGSLRAEATPTDVLDRLLVLTTEALGCDHAGATLTVHRPGVQTTMATDSDLLSLADLQLLGGAGPAVDVATSARPHVLSTDVRRDDRWPSWSAAADRAGVRSVLCVPLPDDGTLLGTLTAYDSTVGHFTHDDVGTAGFLASFAVTAVTAARDHENLWQLVEAARTINQATGILMQRDGLDSQRAFAALQRDSDQQRLPLGVFAERVVLGRVLAD
jgi:GAF domain-containing protein